VAARTYTPTTVKQYYHKLAVSGFSSKIKWTQVNKIFIYKLCQKLKHKISRYSDVSKLNVH